MRHITDQAADNLILTGQFTALKNVEGRRAFVREVETEAGVVGVLIYVAHTRAVHVTERSEGNGHCRPPQSR